MLGAAFYIADSQFQFGLWKVPYRDLSGAGAP
jgi:hypothetical protein